MSVFIGGSAYNMVRDIADGYIIATERTFRNFGGKELADFQQEATRLVQEVRADQPALTDTMAIQRRQRRLQRLMQSLSIVGAIVQRRR
ncbi:MAG TPA: hypothetical protein VKG01_08435 [Thermoanaerobaculia bacterium]|nr:hypothetical protein [Thermoanaerobaculia bacterium]